MLAYQDLLSAANRAPCVESLGLNVVELAQGYCKLTAQHDHRFDGLHPGFHGGMLAAIADSVAWFAAATRTREHDMVTTDMHVRYLNPCLTNAVAAARVIKLGKTLCPVAVEIADENGTNVVVAQVTLMRLSAPRPDA